MKYSREEFAKLILENPNAEILFLVSEDAPYSEYDYSVIEPECINVRVNKCCFIEEYGDKILIERDEVCDDSLIADKYSELIGERFIESSKGIIDEIWKEAEEIVSKYEWFEAIVVYISGP